MATISLLFLSSGVYAQDAPADLSLDVGVQKHARLDDVYVRFSKAYRDLDHKPFSSLYTKDAAYLVPGSNIDIGSDKIVDGFRLFFDSVRSKGERLTISFRIVQRKVVGKMAYDVGIYTLKNYEDGKQIGEGRGKFIVVAVKDGRNWKFQVDAYSDMPKDGKKPE